MNERVLIVDDEMLLSWSISEFLKANGLNSDTVNSGENCLKKLESGYRPDIILMDINLGPGKMDGPEATKKIYDHYNIPVVLHSAYTDKETIGKTKEMTKYGYIQKVPKNEQFLLATIEMALHLHRTESLLEKNKQFLHDVFNSIQDGIIVLDRDLTIVQVNEIMQQWCSEYIRPEGKKCYEVFHKQRVVCNRCPARASMSSGKTERGFELQLPGLSVAWVEVFCYPMRDSRSGEIIGVVEHLRDISKRRKTEEQLSQSYLRSRWLNVIAKHVLTGWDIQEIIDYAVRLIHQYFPEHRVSYATIDTEGHFHCLCSLGPSRMPDITGKKADISGNIRLPMLLKEQQSIVISSSLESDIWKRLRQILSNEESESLIAVPLLHSEEQIGLLSFEAMVSHEWSEHETETLKEVAHYLSLALKNEIVQEKLKESEQQYRELSGHLQKAREEQNAHIAREIHDDLGQSLTALKMNISLLEQDLDGTVVSRNADSIRQTVQDMKEILNTTVTKVRELSKELRPSVLDTSSIIEALEWQTQEFFNYSGIPVRFVNRIGDIELDNDQSLAVFRIVQEALTNVARHARATAAEVEVGKTDGWINVTVRDDGLGFLPDEKMIQGSFGIMSMQERASFCGGSLYIDRGESGGTTLTVHIPISRST